MLTFRIVLFALLYSVSVPLFAQNTCATAEPFCSGSGLTFPAGTNQPAAPAGPNYGCLFTRPNPAWYFINVETSGNINITLTNSGNNDIDFIVWGPFADQASMCTQVFAGAPIVDCSYSAAATEFVDINNAVAGQWYMLLITNFSNQNTNITANQTGGTGSTNCDILCGFNSITATPSACDPLDDTYDLTGNISLSSPPTSGFLIISESCNGNSISLPAPFNTNVSYTFPNLISNAASCTVTASFSADPTCTTSANFTAPASCFVPECIVTGHTATVGPCDPNTVTYTLDGSIDFDFAPDNGTLTVSLCSGEQQVFNAPFVSPINFSFTNLEPNNTLCNVSASFSADINCTYSFDIQEPFPCACPAQIGTYSLTGGSSGVYCHGQSLTLASQNNFVPPVDVSHPTIPYAPGIGYFIFTCPPSITDINFQTDPCYVGLWQTGNNASALNDGNFFNQFAPSTFDNNVFYIVPVTMYNTTLEEVSVTVWAGDCFEMGQPIEVRFLNEMQATITEDCPNGELDIVVEGGGAQFGLGQYSITSILPSIVNATNTTVANGVPFVLNNLQDGMNYSFTIIDQFNCSVAASGGPFIGPIVPTLTPVPDMCSEDPAVALQAAPTGGTWSGPGVNPSGLFNPELAGPGEHLVTYLPAGCAVADAMNINVLYQPDATITSISSVCIYESAFNLTAMDVGGVWSGNGVISPASGTFNPIAAGIGAHEITYTINGFCSDTDTHVINVHPRPEATFTASVTEGCTPLVVNFAYSGSSMPVLCNWEVEGVSQGTVCSNFSYTFPDGGCYDIRYEITDNNGCSNFEEIENLICVTESPVASFGFDLNGANVLNPTVYFTNFSEYATAYSWDFGGQGNYTDENPVFRFDITRGTQIPVCLTAINDLGCVDTECREVNIPEVFFFYVPNTFTPNGDGFNDVFQPSVNGVAGNEVYEYEFEVFSKWGERVYHSLDPDDVWVGNKNGSEYYLPDGVYYWQARIRFVTTEAPRRYEGHLFILR